MYTRCPTCSTYFRVTDRHLAIANGKVRCGKCQLVFNAPEHSIDDLPVKDSAAIAINAPASGITLATKSRLKVPPAPLAPTAKDKNKIQDKVVKEKVAAIKTTATSVIKSTPKKVSIPNIEKSDFDATNSDADEDDIFNKDFDLNAAIDELTQATKEPDNEQNITIKAERVISKPESKQPVENKNNSGDVFTTDAYDATSAASVEDILNEMENQLSIDIDIDKPDTHEEYDIDSEFDFIQPDEKKEQSPSKQENIETNNDVLKKHVDQVDLSDFEDSEIQLHGDIDIPLQLRDDIKLLQTNSPRRLHPLFSLLFIIILITVSFAQLTYYRAHELVNLIPASRPLLEQFCNEVNCHYSGPINTKEIQLLSRDVRLHPKEKKTLLIRAAMINNAYFDQPYPNIHVRLSDLSGNIVAERVFKAKTYLGKSNNPFLLMKSKTPVHINFEVVDPGKDAINFEFTFL